MTAGVEVGIRTPAAEVHNPSYRRKPVSRSLVFNTLQIHLRVWIPAFAGKTVQGMGCSICLRTVTFEANCPNKLRHSVMM